MSRLSLELFGPLTLQARDGAEIAVSADKVRALLAYLALETGRAHRREALAGLLWPEHPELNARQSLTQALSVLNGILAPALGQEPSPLTITRLDVSLSCEGCSLDVRAFEALLAECRAHGHRAGVPCAECAPRLERALALYRGALLEGFSLRDGPEFDAWLLVVRERLRRQAVEAAATLTQWRESMGAHEAAIASGRRWAELDPLDEQAHRSLMRLLAAGGHRSLALAQYETCRQLLRAGLGVEPEQATRDLYDHIRSGDPALVRGGEAPVPEVARQSTRSSPHHNLPAAVDSFVGREREFSEVQSLLRDPAVRLVTLVGAGGMGKTRLALEVARATLDELGGTWFVDLAPLPASAQPGSGPATGLPQGEPRVLRAIANALGVREDAGEAGLAVALMDRRLLLLLDNCEHVLDGVAPLLATLLRSCPDLRVLATSREPLRMPGEHLYEVTPLAMPALADVDGGLAGALESGAMQLLAERASAARYGMVIDESNVRDANAVCRHLDGMPLAIELAAARLTAMDLPELARRLEAALSPGAPDGQRWSLLDSSRGAAHPRQRTLLNTLSWSYGLLDAAEQRLFDRLSVFAGSFTLEGACALCADEVALDSVRVPGLLLTLVDRSLVQRLPAAEGAQRYRLLETLRAFGRERLAERGEENTIAARHAAYYVALAQGVEPVLRLGEPDFYGVMRRLDAEREDLAAAVRWSLRGDGEAALRIVGAVHWWVTWRNYSFEYIDLALAALKRTESRRQELALARARALDLVANWRFNWFQWDELECVSQAELTEAMVSESTSAIAWARWWDARRLERVAGYERADEPYCQTLELARQSGEHGLAAYCEVYLAHQAPREKRGELLDRLLERTPEGFRPYTLQLAGSEAHSNGDLTRAERFLRECICDYTRMGDLRSTGSNERALGHLMASRGCVEEADALLVEGGNKCRQCGDENGYLMALTSRCGYAWLWCAPSGPDLIASALREPRIFAMRGYAAQRAAALARAAFGLGLSDLGRRLMGELETQRGLSLSDEDRANGAEARGWAAYMSGDMPAAATAFRQELSVARRGDWRMDATWAMEHLAWALAGTGELDEAASLLAEAQRERDDMGIVLFPAEVPHHERAMRLAGQRL